MYKVSKPKNREKKFSDENNLKLYDKNNCTRFDSESKS